MPFSCYDTTPLPIYTNHSVCLHNTDISYLEAMLYDWLASGNFIFVQYQQMFFDFCYYYFFLLI